MTHAKPSCRQAAPMLPAGPPRPDAVPALTPMDERAIGPTSVMEGFDGASPGRVSIFTSWNQRCGIAEYSRQLAVELEARRLEVRIVPASFQPSSRGVYAAMGHAMNSGEVAHVQHSYAFWGGMRPRLAGFQDFIQAVRVPVALTLHEFDTRPGTSNLLPERLEISYKTWFNRRSLLAAGIGAWIVHSEELRMGLCELGAPADRLVCLPMPVPRVAAVPSDPAAARRAFGIEGRRALSILGFLARRKGYDVAIEALRRLDDDVVLLCAGGEHAADRTGTAAWIRSLAQAAGVDHRVVITGYLGDEQLSQVIAASELILAPFSEMSASASLALALGHRMPVVASDLPANRALDCVRLFPAGDGAALAEAVRSLLGDSAARSALRERAAAYAARTSFAALADRTLDIYRSLLDGGP